MTQLRSVGDETTMSGHIEETQEKIEGNSNTSNFMNKIADPAQNTPQIVEQLNSVFEESTEPA